MAKFSRRGVILGSFGGAGLAVLAAVGLSGTPESLVRAVLRRALPGVKISDKSLAQFEKEYLTQVEASDISMTKVRLASGAQRIVGLTPLMHIPATARTLERMERDLVTMFLVRSDFFYLDDPQKETVTYIGDQIACANPFARRFGSEAA